MSYKQNILKNICYTEQVYDRINKKLKTILSKKQIEIYLLLILKETNEQNFRKKGKNIYILNTNYNIRITINSNTVRVITVDKQ